MGKLNFSPDIRLGDLVATVGVIVGGALAWSNINAEVAIIKHGQAVQAETNRQIRHEIREVGQQVRETDKTVRDIENKINRARL